MITFQELLAMMDQAEKEGLLEPHLPRELAVA